MNRVARIFVAFGLAAAASTALAAKSPPAEMSEAQMDGVTGGGVVDVLVTNALNDWTINLEVALQANVAANAVDAAAARPKATKTRAIRFMAILLYVGLG